MRFLYARFPAVGYGSSGATQQTSDRGWSVTWAPAGGGGPSSSGYTSAGESAASRYRPPLG